jgi:D-3-phosphoglycerate dehydrogenase
MMKKVLIPTKLDGIAAETLDEHGGYIVVQDSETSLEELIPAHPDTFAMIVRSEKITSDIIDLLPELRVIIRAGAGYNTIDTAYARQKGIDVMNTPGANANAVAEEVIAMILADARHIITADPSVRSGKWEKKKFMGRELAGKTVGIVGLGHIGQLVARRLKGFDVRILGFDPVISRERAEAVGIELVDLEKVFKESDYVSLHAPETDETRGMVNTETLSMMKDGATLINCARAGLVDEAALRAIRQSKTLRFLNDVYDKDAEGEKSVSDIADLMLPHLGANTCEANANAARRAAEQLIEYEEKGVTSYIVNRDIPEGLDEAYCDLANTLAKLAFLLGEGGSLKRIETSFYGSLEPFSDWLIVPIVTALKESFDRSLDYRAAHTHLESMGIEYKNRTPDPTKNYENSITLDMTFQIGNDTLKVTSIRGTVAEGNLMISRMGDFDKLYFEPSGHIAIFVYEDRPGVMGQIGIAMAEEDINIEDIRNPHNVDAGRSIAILKVNKPVPPAVLKKVKDKIGTRSAFYIEL